MRVLPVLIVAMAFAAPALAEKPQPEVNITYEADTYRFAEVYRSERGSTVEACAMMCSRDQACASWSLTPATFRIGPRCELKTSPGAASHRPGAASGMSEMWQMDSGRHADMRFQPGVPNSRQPPAVPVDQVRPSPVPRTFGDPPPVREPELMGGPKTQVSAVLRRTDTVVEVQPEVMVAPQHPPATPRPAPVKIAVAPARAEAPTEPAPKARMVFKDPSRDVAALPTTDDYNAVLKRERQAPAPQAAKAPAQPAPARTPWTERDGTAPDYSVRGTDYIPGDEDATAGFVDGAPEAGT